jgi:hypothetical protein
LKFKKQGSLEAANAAGAKSASVVERFTRGHQRKKGSQTFKSNFMLAFSSRDKPVTAF